MPEFSSGCSGKRLTYQAGNALSQRVVEALDVIGFTGQLADRPALR
jgi:hypothetical protein